MVQKYGKSKRDRLLLLFNALFWHSRDKRQIIGYDIAFDKSREKIQKLVDSSPTDAHYYSVAYSSYSEICYHGIHIALKNKS